jgi:hypothetical protein
MKNEILDNGIEKTISSKQRNINNLVFITFVMSLTALICAVMLAVQTRKTEALEFQVSQRDSIIAAQNAHLNELTFDNINLANSIR